MRTNLFMSWVSPSRDHDVFVPNTLTPKISGELMTCLLRRVLRRVLETAFEKVLRRFLRRCLAVASRGKKDSEKGS